MFEKLNEFDVTFETSESIKQKLDSIRNLISKKKCFLGLDGYVDSLYSIVKSRESSEVWTKMNSMKTFGNLITNVAGSSANIERVLKRKISGGFAPNSCKALNELGVKVFLTASLGYPNINKVFLNFLSKKKIEAFSFANPGETTGLEFDDGKIMLTDLENILNINWDLLMERIGFENIFNIIEKSDVIGFGHWSLIPNLGEIWAYFISDILPSIKNNKEKLFFVDLGDVKKRNKNDILIMLNQLQKIDRFIPVMLSLNDQEAIDVSKALENVKNINPRKKQFKDYVEGGKQINKELNLSYIVIHSPHFSTISTKKNHYWITQGFTSKPSFTTGAGDYFHSGTAVGIACDLLPAEAILLGNALTAIFVRTGNSPNFDELTQFITKYLNYIETDNPNFP
ncbi:MAG: PfkB family carbohydrate kinase [Promethearchaeota archaeon]